MATTNQRESPDRNIRFEGGMVRHLLEKKNAKLRSGAWVATDQNAFLSAPSLGHGYLAVRGSNELEVYPKVSRCPLRGR